MGNGKDSGMNSVERLSSERGAIFVQVGIALFVLIAFNVFILDYGVVWVARRQAQNAADAGALAGAVARGYDDFDIRPLHGNRSANRVERGGSESRLAAAGRVRCDVQLPRRRHGKCVRVDVYREREAGSAPLPTFFGPMLGVVITRRARHRDRGVGERQRHQLPATVCVRRRLVRSPHALQ